MEMLAADIMERAVNAAFEQRKSGRNSDAMYAAQTCVLAFRVIGNAVPRAPSK